MGLRLALLTVDHTSSTTCRHLPGFYIGTKLYSLVTEAHGCEQVAHSRYAAAPGRGSNPRPLNRKSDALPLRHHHATQHRHYVDVLNCRLNQTVWKKNDSATSNSVLKAVFRVNFGSDHSIFLVNFVFCCQTP